LPKEYRDELKHLHKEVASIVADEAEQRVPVQSGRLKGSIRPLGSQKQGRVAAGKKSVPYAGPIHFGWPRRNITPQPFLTDALDRRKNEVLDTWLDLQEQLIDKVWSGIPGQFRR